MCQDLEEFRAIITAQSKLVHLQTEVIQEYLRQNNELLERVAWLEEEVRRLRALTRQTLGDLILIEDNEPAVKEEERIPGVIYDLIEIND